MVYSLPHISVTMNSTMPSCHSELKYLWNCDMSVLILENTWGWVVDKNQKFSHRCVGQRSFLTVIKAVLIEWWWNLCANVRSELTTNIKYWKFKVRWCQKESYLAEAIGLALFYWVKRGYVYLHEVSRKAPNDVGEKNAARVEPERIRCVHSSGERC